MENKNLIKTISYELINNYVQGWHEVTEEYPAMFANSFEIAEPIIAKENKIEEEWLRIAEQNLQTKLKHFNDNYYAYKQVGDSLVFDETRIGWDEKVYNAHFEIKDLEKWFIDYDRMVSEHLRCERLGVECHHNIVELDNQAKTNQEQLKVLRLLIG